MIHSRRLRERLVAPAGVEPASLAYEAGMLPLHHGALLNFRDGGGAYLTIAYILNAAGAQRFFIIANHWS